MRYLWTNDPILPVTTVFTEHFTMFCCFQMQEHLPAKQENKIFFIQMKQYDKDGDYV